MPKNPNRIASGKKSKRKGNRSEREVAKLLQTWWGHGDFVRTPSSGGWATKTVREGFRTAGDIVTNVADWPFTVENKSQESWSLDALMHNDGCIAFGWWKQALSETPEGSHALLIAGRNRIPRVVMFNPQTIVTLTQGARPWEYMNHFIVNRYREGDHLAVRLVVMPLTDFFKIDPCLFGRRLPDENKEMPKVLENINSL